MSIPVLGLHTSPPYSFEDVIAAAERKPKYMAVLLPVIALIAFYFLLSQADCVVTQRVAQSQLHITP